MLALPVALDPAAPAQGVRARTASSPTTSPTAATGRGRDAARPTRLVLGYGRIPTAGVDAAVAGLAAALRDAGL